MTKSALAVFNTKLASKHKAQKVMPFIGKTLTSSAYSQIVNCFQRILAIDENVVDTEDEIDKFSRSQKDSSQYAE